MRTNVSLLNRESARSLKPVLAGSKLELHENAFLKMLGADVMGRAPQGTQRTIWKNRSVLVDGIMKGPTGMNHIVQKAVEHQKPGGNGEVQLMTAVGALKTGPTRIPLVLLHNDKRGMGTAAANFFMFSLRHEPQTIDIPRLLKPTDYGMANSIQFSGHTILAAVVDSVPAGSSTYYLIVPDASGSQTSTYKELEDVLKLPIMADDKKIGLAVFFGKFSHITLNDKAFPPSREKPLPAVITVGYFGNKVGKGTIFNFTPVIAMEHQGKILGGILNGATSAGETGSQNYCVAMTFKKFPG